MMYALYNRHIEFKGARFIMSISIFGFRALWSPGLMIVTVLLIALYFLVTVKFRDKFKESEPLTRSEIIYFLLAMLLFYGIKGTPIDLMGHIMFTLHMVQMALMLLLLPIFIIKGIPWWVWKPLINAPVIRVLWNFFTRPVVAMLNFIALFSFYHIPMVLDYVKLNGALHGGYSVILFISAVLMYWPIINQMPDGPKMKNLNSIVYIIANAVLITPACALIIFANDPIYATYTDGEAWLKAMELCVPAGTLANLSISISGPEMFSSLTTIMDQQMGGVIMKILQEIIFGVLITVFFMRWYREDRATADQVTEDALKAHQEKWHREQASIRQSQ